MRKVLFALLFTFVLLTLTSPTIAGDMLSVTATTDKVIGAEEYPNPPSTDFIPPAGLMPYRIVTDGEDAEWLFVKGTNFVKLEFYRGKPSGVRVYHTDPDKDDSVFRYDLLEVPINEKTAWESFVGDSKVPEIKLDLFLKPIEGTWEVVGTTDDKKICLKEENTKRVLVVLPELCLGEFPKKFNLSKVGGFYLPTPTQ